MNCFKCEHSDTIPGNCHLTCNHPDAKAIKDKLSESDPMFERLQKFPGMAYIGVSIVIKSLNQKFNQKGIDGGWCNYPYNFDPVWVIKCDGFSEVTANAKN